MSLRKKGLTLAKIASELDQSISWVNARLNVDYAPKGEREGEFEQIEKIPVMKIDRKETIEGLLKKLDEEEEALDKELVEIDEELNCPLNRSYEDLIEYRKERDKDVGAPPAVPVFD